MFSYGKVPKKILFSSNANISKSKWSKFKKKFHAIHPHTSLVHNHTAECIKILTFSIFVFALEMAILE